MKTILVYRIHGKYEDTECIHDYIAIFPEDATDAEITIAVGETWEEVKAISFSPTQIRAYIRNE